MRTGFIARGIALSAVAAILLAGVATSAKAEADSGWTAYAYLKDVGASHCGSLAVEKMFVTIKNNKFTAKSERVGGWSFSLAPLKPDGSGAITRGDYTFNFSAGTGPREIVVRENPKGCVRAWQLK